MKKLPSLFVRDLHDGRWVAKDEILPGCEWVVSGEGVATRKWDGHCCLIEDGRLFKRHTIKPGRPTPPHFRPAQDPDPYTGKIPGWMPLEPGTRDRWFRAAFKSLVLCGGSEDGTYELCGPHIQGNVEGFQELTLIKHGTGELFDAPTTFLGLTQYFKDHDIEGIVWHHPDGRMVKITGRDFNIFRGPE